MRIPSISKCALALFVATMGASPAFSETTLRVLYSNAYVNKDSMEKLVQLFEEQNKGTAVKLDVVKNYTEMTQLMLRSSLTGDVPDVGFQGLSFVRLFAERGLAVPLQGFIAQENGWENRGYSQSVMSMAKKGEETIGIPYQLSVPIVYFNIDLVRKAGAIRTSCRQRGREFPTWQKRSMLPAEASSSTIPRQPTGHSSRWCNLKAAT